jgi:8-amino-7-oxononanoate synthase
VNVVVRRTAEVAKTKHNAETWRVDDIISKWNSLKDRDQSQQRDDNGFIAGFAGYRNLKRRFASVARHGITVPFFQPRDGVSASTIRWHGRELINYSGYNYLGLSGHPKVSAAAKAAIDKYGTSASASRIVSGQIELHGELEKRVAAFLGTEDALVFVSGYLTNVTVISHLMGRADAVFYDSAAHNSILTGARLSGSRMVSFAHGDWDALQRSLSECRSEFRRGLLIGEGVYSMDGTIFNLPRALEVKKQNDLLLMVDEAHSLGTLGRTGRGISEYHDIPPSEIDIHMGTLSKTLAGCGGYIAGERGLIEYLRYLAPGFIFSVGLSPPDTGAAIAALDVLESEPSRTTELRQRTERFRQLAQQWGIPVGGATDAPVASLVVGNGDLCMLLSHRLLEQGIHVQPIVYPAVALDGARLRFFITIDHTEAQFRATMPVLAKELEAIPQPAK